MIDKETKKTEKTDRNLDRFMLDADSIVILKKGGKVCDPKDKTCKIEE